MSGVVREGLVAALFKAVSALKLGRARRRPRAHYDKVRLLDGQRFDIGFTIGLAHSAVFAPTLSSSCCESFVQLGAEDRVDFVLVECVMALALHRRGIVKATMPVNLNEQPDGTHTDGFWQELLSGTVGGHSIPDVVSKLTMAKAAEFLQLLTSGDGGPIDLDPDIQQWTMRQLVKELLKFQAVLLHLDSAWTTVAPAVAGLEHTRAAVVSKLAGRLVGAAEKFGGGEAEGIESSALELAGDAVAPRAEEAKNKVMAEAEAAKAEQIKTEAMARMRADAQRREEEARQRDEEVHDGRHRIWNAHVNELLYVGSKQLDQDRRCALTWTGRPNQDPAMVWQVSTSTASEPAAGTRRISIRNVQTDEYLYAGSKMLDPARRHALTWTGTPVKDPASTWELIAMPNGRHLIKNTVLDELLYVGSKKLDPNRRFALTWTGEPNQDPAMLWELVLA